MYAAKVWLCIGIVLVVISLAISFITVRSSLSNQSVLLTVMVLVQTLLAVLTIVPVELHLRHFDNQE